MTNFEFYKDKILDIVKNGNEFALVNNEIIECKDNESYCDECSFKGANCASDCIKWLYEEYKEPITPTISQKEKALLEIIQYDFFIRNHLGEIYATSKKPKIYYGKAVIDGDADSINLSKAFNVSFEFITWKTVKIWTRQELLSLEVIGSEENNNESNQQIQEEELEVTSTMTLDEAIEHCLEKSDCTGCGKEHSQLANWLKELLQYKKLGKQGLLLRLPCKAGDTLYVLVKTPSIIQDCTPYSNFTIVDYKVKSVAFSVNKAIVSASTDNPIIDNYYKNIVISSNEFGNTVFKTKEEAQEALINLN